VSNEYAASTTQTIPVIALQPKWNQPA
jgi:hypothetical protein